MNGVREFDFFGGDYRQMGGTAEVADGSGDAGLEMDLQKHRPDMALHDGYGEAGGWRALYL